MENRVADVLDLERYAEQIEAVATSSVLLEKFSEAMAQLGFEETVFQPLIGHAEPVTEAEVESSMPQAQAAHPHVFERPYQDDPVVRDALTHTGAFYIKSDRSTISQRESLGLVEDPPENGAEICIPLRGSGGTFALVQAKTTRNRTERLNSYVLGLAQAVASIFYSKLCALRADVRPHVYLTCKERQVLAFVAKGHTKNAIAETMGVTNHAVDFHFRNILKKYETNRIVVAVVKAMRGGVI